MAPFFGNTFDFNGDGKLDSMETAADFGAFANLTGLGGDTEDKLQSAGLDINELQMMDEDELKEALEDAGLDPEDFDL